MGDLIGPAKKIAGMLLKDVDMTDKKNVNKILRDGYAKYKEAVYYGGTSSGYKAWRRACRIAKGEIPERKKSKREIVKYDDPNQLNLPL